MPLAQADSESGACKSATTLTRLLDKPEAPCLHLGPGPACLTRLATRDKLEARDQDTDGPDLR